MAEAQHILLVEYYVMDDIILIFGVRADWNEPVQIEYPMSRQMLRHFVQQYFGSFQSDNAPHSTGNRIREMPTEEWQKQLGSLVNPILDWCQAGDYVYLVPHDVLHYLPLHALQINGQYLFERNPVSYVPSLSILRYCQQRRHTRSNQILIFGDSAVDNPLDSAREEALEIAHSFNTFPLLGNSVTKQSVIQQLTQSQKNVDIIHFACHGYFNSDEPLKSGILMAPNDQDELTDTPTILGFPANRILTAEDFLVYRLTLIWSLLVLAMQGSMILSQVMNFLD